MSLILQDRRAGLNRRLLWQFALVAPDITLGGAARRDQAVHLEAIVPLQAGDGVIRIVIEPRAEPVCRLPCSHHPHQHSGALSGADVGL